MRHLFHGAVRVWLIGCAIIAVCSLAVSLSGYKIHVYTFTPDPSVGASDPAFIDPHGPAYLCSANYGPTAYGIDRKTDPAKRSKDYAACMASVKAGTFFNEYVYLLWLGTDSVNGIDHAECILDDRPNPVEYCSDGFSRHT